MVTGEDWDYKTMIYDRTWKYDTLTRLVIDNCGEGMSTKYRSRDLFFRYVCEKMTSIAPNKL